MAKLPALMLALFFSHCVLQRRKNRKIDCLEGNCKDESYNESLQLKIIQGLEVQQPQ